MVPAGEWTRPPDTACVRACGRGLPPPPVQVDATNIFLSVWPDLTQIAERLWSPKAPENGGLDLLDGRRRRLRLHRCRLASRGVPVGPMGAVYMPDASHASFATWREYQWCESDAGTASSRAPAGLRRHLYGPGLSGVLGGVGAEVEAWSARHARQHRRRTRAQPLPFDAL